MSKIKTMIGETGADILRSAVFALTYNEDLFHNDENRALIRNCVRWMDNRNEHLNQGRSVESLLTEYCSK